MPRGRGRKRPATSPAGSVPGPSRGRADRSLPPAEIRRLLAEDSDAEPESDADTSDSHDEPERILASTGTEEEVTAEVTASSEDSSDEDEGATQAAVDLVRVEQRSQQFQARSGRIWTTEIWWLH